jgi:cell wall assembly regulator SMI1
MKALLSEIKSLLADSFPELAASLNPPATEATVRRAEEQMDRVWPEELKELYRLHDGEANGCGLFFGLPFLRHREQIN